MTPGPIDGQRIPTPVRELCQRLCDSGHQAWVVGGSVRDLARGRGAKDWDVATSAAPEQVRDLFRRVVPTGIQHGTVTVLMKGQGYEVTTFRGEGAYTDGRHPDEVFYVDTIEEDLARRDFTVNAMAYDPIGDRFADPFGGRQDLDQGILRAVGEPAERFREDGLRMMRAARFVATLALELDPATEKAMVEARLTLAKVSRERVRDEWKKALTAEEPSRAFEIMRRTGLLDLTCPLLLEQVDCEQNRHHAYDVWTHTMACVDAADPDPIVRLAALLHDLGKPRSRQRGEDGDWTFYHHEKIGADLADHWLRDYRFSNDERTRVVLLVRHHLVCYSPAWTDAAVRRFLRRVGPDHVPSLLRLARADALAKGRVVEDELAALDELQERIQRVTEEGAALQTRDLAIGGRDLIAHFALKPGPWVGRILAKLLEIVVEDPAQNEATRLLSLAEALHREELDS